MFSLSICFLSFGSEDGDCFRSKAFKGAIKMFKNLNCDDPKLVSYSLMSRQGSQNRRRGPAGAEQGRTRHNGGQQQHQMHNRMTNRQPQLTVTLPETLRLDIEAGDAKSSA
jgi:hypothetical protein